MNISITPRMCLRTPCHSSLLPFSTCTPILGHQWSAFCHYSWVWRFFRVLCKWTHVVCPLSCLDSFTLHNWGSSMFLLVWLIYSFSLLSGMTWYGYTKICLSIHFQRTFAFPFFGYYKDICSKHLCTCLLHIKSPCGIIFSFLWSTHPVVDVWSKW